MLPNFNLPKPWEWCWPPPAIYPGVNIVTPLIAGYARTVVHRKRTIYVEISVERSPYLSSFGLSDAPGPLIGLTFKRPNGRRLDPDPSTCVRTPEQIMDKLLEVAGRYASK